MSLPLILPAYHLDATASVVTTIVTNYYTSQVSFYDESIVVYTAMLLQAAPTLVLPDNLHIGNFVIISGTLQAKFPISMQAGTITLNCIYTDLNTENPTPLNTVVATWSLGQ